MTGQRPGGGVASKGKPSRGGSQGQADQNAQARSRKSDSSWLPLCPRRWNRLARPRLLEDAGVGRAILPATLLAIRLHDLLSGVRSHGLVVNGFHRDSDNVLEWRQLHRRFLYLLSHLFEQQPGLQDFC